MYYAEERRRIYIVAKNISTVIIGGIYDTNNFGKYIVLSFVGKDKSRRFIFNIEFINTGYKTTVTSLDIANGEIKDYLVRTVCGIGYLEKPRKYFQNKLIYQKIYTAWKNMITRCYDLGSPNYLRYGLQNVTVDERWLSFWNFYNDVILLKGWNESIFMMGLIEIDKDTLQMNIKNKIYSLNTCIWLDTSLNHGLTKSVYNKTVKGFSPDGNKYNFQNIEKFARENNLTAPNIVECLKGRALKHKGWTFSYC